MNDKIGRNSACWCGSNIKYKKCHLTRDKQEPLKNWQVGKEISKVQSYRICSSPDSFHHECSGNIIRAHTVPKSSSLKAIAENGHVLGLNTSYEAISRNKGKIKLELIGVNSASTFNGFCKNHDDVIFSPLEKMLFNSTEQQCFLLAYRAFAREYYAKNAAMKLAPLRQQADKGKSKDVQMSIQFNNLLVNVGTSTAMEDLNYHKKFFDKSLDDIDYSSVRAIIFSFESPPPVMMSGCLNPDYDFSGKLIQDLMDLNKRTDSISLTSYYDGSKGLIVFSWLENSHPTCCGLIKSLLEKDKKTYEILLAQYMFKNFENIYVSPSWWDSVDESSQRILLKLLSDNISYEELPNSHGLTEIVAKFMFPKIVNIEFVNWKP